MKEFDYKDRDAIKKFVKDVVRSGESAKFRINNISPRLNSYPLIRDMEIFMVILMAGHRNSIDYSPKVTPTPGRWGRSCTVQLRRRK